MMPVTTRDPSQLEPPIEPKNGEDALLLAELLAVGATIPAVAGEVASVGHVLHAKEEIQWLSAPLMAPTPVVSSAAAVVPTRISRSAAMADETRGWNATQQITGRHATRPPMRTSSC